MLNPDAGTWMIAAAVIAAVAHAGGDVVIVRYACGPNATGVAGIGGLMGCAASGFRARDFTLIEPVKPAPGTIWIVIIPVLPSLTSPKMQVFTPSPATVAEMRNTFPTLR